MKICRNSIVLVYLWSLGTINVHLASSHVAANTSLTSRRIIQELSKPFGEQQTPFATSVSAPFALPYVFPTSGKLWSSNDLLGKQSFLMLVGLQPRLQELTNTSVEPLSQHQFATPLIPAELEKIAILDKRPLSTSETQAASKLGVTLLRDEKGDLSQRYGNPVSELTLVAVDKAGFVRRIEGVTDFADIARRLSEISDPTPKLAIGQRAPDFSIRDMNGKMRRVSELYGRKNLLLTFFPKCFTYTCTKQLTSLQTAQAELAREDTEIWAASVDTAEGPQGQRAFVKKLGLNFPLIPDTGRNLSILYGASQRPNQFAARMSVLIDKHGIVRWIEKQMSPRSHGPDVLAQLHSWTTANPK